MNNKNRNFPEFYKGCNISDSAISMSVIEANEIDNDHLYVNDDNENVVGSPECSLLFDRSLHMIHVSKDQHKSQYE